MLTYRTNPVFFLAAVTVVYLAPYINVARADVPTIQVRICIPPQLVTDESWETPYPGSDMQAFRNTIRDYVAAYGGSGQIEYWIRDDAFDRFRAAAANSYAPDPQTLVQEVSSQSECPASNYTAEQEVDAMPAQMPQTTASAYPDAVSPAVNSDNDDADDVTGYVAGAAAAAIVWCVLGGCSSDDSSSGDESSSYQYDPPEDPFNNPYQQYLDERHAACVWAYSDISNC